MDDILDQLEEKLECHNYGTYLAALCIFHSDSSPSMMVYPDSYRCLSCGAHGKTSDLLRKLSNTTLFTKPSTPDYRNPWTSWLRHDTLAHILKSSWQILTSQPSLGNYLTGRGITQDWRKKLGIGYREDWYTIPIRDANHKIVGAVARANAETNHTKSKYIMPAGQSTDLLYVPSWDLLQKQSELYLTFGILDAITLNIIGLASASTTGGKHLNPSALDSFRKRIVIVPDRNEEREALCIAKELGWRGSVMKIDYPDTMKDPNDLLVNQVIHQYFN